MSGPPQRWTWRRLAVMALLVAGCGAPSSPPGTAPPDYRTAICGGIQGLARTAPDYKTFFDYLNDSEVGGGSVSARADALAALGRVTERTGKAIGDFETAGQLWEPGADAAEGLATMSRDVLPILVEYKAASESLLPEPLATADAHYNDWSDGTGRKVDAALADLDRLGVSCS